MKTDQREGRTKRRAIRGDANIAAQRKTEPRTRTWAVHRRYNRLRQRAHGASNLLPFSQDGAKSLFVLALAQMLQVIDITTCAETSSFTGDDQYTNCVIGCDFGQNIQDLVANRPAEGVQLLRTVQFEQTDSIL